MDERLELSRRRDEIVGYLPQLQRYAGALTRDRAASADLVQDTMERALRALPKLRANSSLLGWLRTLLHNRFIDWMRRPDRRSVGIEGRDIATPIADDSPPPPWLDIGPAEVRKAIDLLPPHFSKILRMRLVSRMSYREIGQQLRISDDTVGTRLLRARRRLRVLLLSALNGGALAPLPPSSAQPPPIPIATDVVSSVPLQPLI